MKIHARSFAVAVLLGLFAAAESAIATDAAIDGDALIFAGSGFGAIPDAPPSGPICGDGNAGAPRAVTFAAAVPSGVIVAVDVSVTIEHPWAGDVSAILIDPTGTHIAPLFGRVGAVSPADCGDSSTLAGSYVFTDLEGASGFWEAANAAGIDEAIAPGPYYSTYPGGAGAVNPAPPMSLNFAFAGMTSAQASGTWTLLFADSGDDDTGSVTDASLTLFVGSDTIFENGFDPTP